jgi:hypothetical protein
LTPPPSLQHKRDPNPAWQNCQIAAEPPLAAAAKVRCLWLTCVSLKPAMLIANGFEDRQAAHAR